MKPTTAAIAVAGGTLGGAGMMLGAYGAARFGTRGWTAATLCAAAGGAALALVGSRWRRLSITDDGTTLYNRRYLFARLEHELRRAQRVDAPLSCIVAEIDDMRRYNNTFGHLTGDEVLLAVAQELRDNVRRNGYVARWGGDEFGIILPNTELDVAALVAERLRASISRLVVPRADSVITNITISVGVAANHPPNTTSRALIDAADQAMYHAKQRKNYVVVAST